MTKCVRGDVSWLAHLSCLVLCCFPAAGQGSAPVKAAEAKPAGPEELKPVQISEIPGRIQESATMVRAALQHAAPLDRIKEIERAFPEFAAGTRSMLEGSRNFVGLGRSAEDVSRLRDMWGVPRRQLEDWQTLLRNRSGALQNHISILRRESEIWTATKESAEKQQIPRDVVSEIDKHQQSISDTEAAALSRRNEILKLQGAVSSLSIELDQLDDELRAVEGTERGRMFRLDAPPIWRSSRIQPEKPATEGTGKAAAPYILALLKVYTGKVLEVFTTLFLAFIAILALLLLLRRRNSDWLNGGGIAIQRLCFLAGRPYSVSLLLTALVGALFLRGVPAFLTSLSWYLASIPMLRIVPGMISPVFRPGIWALVGLYWANGILVLLPRHSAASRVFEMILAATSAAGMYWFNRNLGRRVAPGGWRKAAQVCALGAVVLLLSAAVAEVAGATNLSKYLIEGTLTLSYGGAVLWAAVLAIGCLLQLALQPSRLDTASIPDDASDGWERRLSSGLHWLGGLLFLILALRAFEFAEPAADAVKAFLKVGASIGAVEFSVGSVVTFAGVFLAVFALSRVLRFFLSATLYRQIALQRGTGEAISKLLHYSLLTGGFLLAIAAAGIDLNKFTVLAGALGVGVGFGLQNIVNNFVSGLILLFERPLHVGDTITIGDTSGEVKDIGIRASTILTWDGADVIVPNASLVSGSVTNWTLTDNRRRSELKVGVAYGTDPQRVLRILRELAMTQPGILKEPEPIPLFAGFGESSLDFSVRYWTPFEQVVEIKSQFHVAVCERLAHEGIEIPFPQRDLHVRNAPKVDHAGGLTG